MRSHLLSLLSLLWLASYGVAEDANLAYYRHPALHADTVVFTSEGDLWRVPVTGGRATRLTTHGEQETHAAISPDGTRLAFSASYEGPTEVYVMPLSGGAPQRVTYDGEYAAVVGWTPDQRIVYATRHYSDLPNTQLVAVSPETAEITRYPLEQACEVAFTPDAQTLFFARTTPQSGAVKRYKGGTAQQLWRFTLGDDEAVRLTDPDDYAGASREPMWHDHRVYYLTDRDGTMNIWSMSEDGTDLRQHTHHEHFDVQTPSLHKGRIVYQQGADLYLYDTQDAAAPTRLSIQLTSDFDQTREKWIEDPMEWLSDAELSPDGDRVVLTTRGHVFVQPTGPGRRIRITTDDQVRHRAAMFSADGKDVIALSDRSGEFEFWKYPANGESAETQLTDDADVLRWQGMPSPNGQYLAYTDKNFRLGVLNLKTGNARTVFQSDVDDIGAVRWSPDSQWLAFAALADNSNHQIRIYRVCDQTTVTVTSDRVNSYAPAWDPDGKWLYFLSDRHFVSQVGSPWGRRQPEPYIANPTKVYLLALQPGVVSPFLPNTELKGNDDEDAGEAGKTTAAKKKQNGKQPVKIDFAGIRQRLYTAPVTPGQYSSLAATKDHLYYMSYDPESRSSDLRSLKLAFEPKKQRVAGGVYGFRMSADRSRVMVRRGSSIYVFKANGAPFSSDQTRLNLSGWRFPIKPRDEWRQMFIDAWRMERDYFYDRGMHGTDWEALRDRYLPLVDRVHDRDELNHLIYQLVGELEALHIRVSGGDSREAPNDVSIASLGARLVRDEEAGGYRVALRYKTDPEYPEELSPLARPEVDVHEGDVVVAINHVPTLSVTQPQALLRNQVGRQVLLEVKDGETGKQRKVVVQPISMSRESSLRYSHWEFTRRQRVEDRSDSNLGYLHLRAMGGRNYTEFVRNFYPVFRRQGLIIDVRHNRGGNIDSWILGRLMRKAWFFWQPRIGQPYWNMQYAFRGHMVVLCDEYTASDGEAFAEGFRRLGLGEVIGKRTWGGEIWLTSSNRLVDDGIATAAEFGVYGPDGIWLIEGHGVVPDIKVENLPHATFQGQDAQLDRAIDYLLQKIKEEPVEIPPHPAYPDKTPDR